MKQRQIATEQQSLKQGKKKKRSMQDKYKIIEADSFSI
jgi:hypothetical protein